MFKINNTIKNPVTRLFDGGWQTLGVLKREVDSRTCEQLRDNIDFYSQRNNTVKVLSNEIKKLNPKYMGIICDTLELSDHRSMMTSLEGNLDKMFKKVTDNTLLPQMVSASKKNPSAMDLAGAIIDNTDSITSKYALYAMSGGIMKDKELSRQMLAVSKEVDSIAAETLQGGYTMDFTKQENFVDFLKTLIVADALPDKIHFLFRKLIPFTAERSEIFEIDIPKFIRSKIDTEDIAARLKMLPKLLGKNNLKKNDIDIVEYLTKTDKV